MVFEPAGRRLARMRKVAAGMIAALCSVGAGAASLTLDEALNLAEQSNPTLRAVQARLVAAEGQARDARSLMAQP